MESAKYVPVGSVGGLQLSETRPRGTWLERHEKWRLALLFAAAGTSLVFVLNLVIAIWAFAAHGITHGSAELYEGSCETTKNLNIGIHLVINIFSSVILSGSNYTMQCLSSPTRSEVDNAHSRGTWLDIGVSSVRNLGSIAKRRKWLWIALCASSVPLHLFYNSVVFTTLSASSYSVFIVNEAWLSADLTIPIDKFGPVSSDIAQQQLWTANQAGELQRLEPGVCIEEYARSFVSVRSNLLVITSSASNISESAELFDTESGGDITITGGQDAANLDAYSWICGESLECLDFSSGSCNEYAFCDIDDLGIRETPENWRLAGRQVDYCLSARTEEHCKLRLHVGMAVVVILFNALKAGLVILAYVSLTEHLLFNIGDAITSFFERPDATTEGSCLVSLDDVTRKAKDYKVPMGPQVFHDERKHWFSAASRRRVITVFAASIIGLVICTALLVYGVFSMKGAKPWDIWSLGFGRASAHTLMTFKGIRRRMIRAAGVLWNVLIANSPQVILSFLYFTCNGLLTSMLLSQEWSSYAYTRKGLRVQAQPQGSQRSSYFLQLPWRYGIILIIISTTLHWLASQSIFLVSVELWTNLDSYTAEEKGLRLGDWARDDFHDFATCGYSPMALFLFIVLAAVFLLGVGALSFRRFPSGMPVAGSCSLAIASACHTDRDQEYRIASQMPLQWGALETFDPSGDSVGRCGFSSGHVTYPRKGQHYG